MRAPDSSAAKPLWDQAPFHLGPWTVTPPRLTMERADRAESTIRLQHKEMQLLVALAAQGARPLDAQALRRAVWGDQAVSDGVLKNLVWRLRNSIGESADEPRLIETIPGMGYRLALQPTPLAESAPDSKPTESAKPTESGEPTGFPKEGPAKPAPAAETEPPSQPFVASAGADPQAAPKLPAAPRAPRLGHRLAVTAASLAAAVLLPLAFTGFYSLEISPPGRQPGDSAQAGAPALPRSPGVPRLVVDLPGPESDIALDPSGRYLLFCRQSAADAEVRGRHLYVLDLDDPSEIPLRLSEGEDVLDGSPAWSPNGGRIAFARQVDRALFEIRVMTAAGGASHGITEIESETPPQIAWPHEDSLVIARQRLERSDGLALLSLTDGSLRRLTSATLREFHGYPAASPDGRQIAFVSMTVPASRLQLLDLETGDVRTLTRDMLAIRFPAWQPSGDRLLFVGSDSSAWTMWEIATASQDGEPAPAPMAAMDVSEVTVSTAGTLAYRQSQLSADVIRFRGLSRTPDGRLEAQRDSGSIHWSDRLETAPIFHPTLDRSVFLSDRTGSIGLWLTDGQEPPIRLAVDGISWYAQPQWSPDGSRLALSLLRDGQFDLAVLQVGADPSARPRVDFLTDTPDFLENFPIWRPDGLALHYARRSTQSQEAPSLWEQELWQTSSPRRLATNINSYQPAGERHLVIQRNDHSLERVDIGGGHGLGALQDASRFEPLPIDLAPLDSGNWVALPDGVLWATMETTTLRYYDFETGRTSEVAQLEYPAGFAALELAADGRTLFVSRIVRQDSRLWVLAAESS